MKLAQTNMKWYQRAALILAHEGMSGLFQRANRRLLSEGYKQAQKVREKYERAQKAREEYEQLIANFNEKALSMGYGNLSKYLWYHTIDLGNGLITPDQYDYRPYLQLFKFPADMREMSILDVGSATASFLLSLKRGELMSYQLSFLQ